jgi:hypothetical protein
LGTYEELFSTHRYRDIQRELSHVTLAQRAPGPGVGVRTAKAMNQRFGCVWACTRESRCAVLDGDRSATQTRGRGSELEVALARPVGQEVDDLGEVGLGVDVVQLAGGDEREEVRGGGRVVIGAEEEPGLPAYAAAQRPLGMQEPRELFELFELFEQAWLPPRLILWMVSRRRRGFAAEAERAIARQVADLSMASEARLVVSGRAIGDEVMAPPPERWLTIVAYTTSLLFLLGTPVIALLARGAWSVLVVVGAASIATSSVHLQARPDRKNGRVYYGFIALCGLVPVGGLFCVPVCLMALKEYEPRSVGPHLLAALGLTLVQLWFWLALR